MPDEQRGVRKKTPSNMRINRASTKVRERGGGGVPGARPEISLQPVKRTVVEQISVLQPKGELMLDEVYPE